MKKIILFVALATFSMAFNACSSDDSDSSKKAGSITLTIDGTTKTFNTVVITDYSEMGQVRVTASIGDDTTEIIEFTAYKEQLGAHAVFSFEYTINGIKYNGNSLVILTQVNSDNKLKGSFSGTLSNSPNNIKNVTDGTFSINY